MDSTGPITRCDPRPGRRKTLARGRHAEIAATRRLDISSRSRAAEALTCASPASQSFVVKTSPTRSRPHCLRPDRTQAATEQALTTPPSNTEEPGARQTENRRRTTAAPVARNRSMPHIERFSHPRRATVRRLTWERRAVVQTTGDRRDVFEHRGVEFPRLLVVNATRSSQNYFRVRRTGGREQSPSLPKTASFSPHQGGQGTRLLRSTRREVFEHSSPTCFAPFLQFNLRSGSTSARPSRSSSACFILASTIEGLDHD